MPGIREMTLPRCIELQWQREVVERWLNSPDTPFDARSGLLDMLSMVKEEIEREGEAGSSAQSPLRAHKPEGELTIESDRVTRIRSGDFTPIK